MKIALISDIHGNLEALNAVLRHARANNAARVILNLGDAVGYGPQPEEVVQFIQGSSFTNILGNYDQKILSKKHRKAGWSSVKTPEKREMFAWTYQALSKKSRKYLNSLPKSLKATFEGVTLLMTHGSPDSISEHLLPNTPEKRLLELAEQHPVDAILCGHSHQPFTRKAGGVCFVNPGSVGRPDDGDPRASYAILELQDGEIEVKQFRVAYPIQNAINAMRQTGLPEIFTEVIRQGLNFDDARQQLQTYPQKEGLEPSGILTLLTDFGIKDHFVGVMEGVIANIAPQTQVIDISHQVQPQDIEAGARMLEEAVPYFPPGTVHVAVIDPGVGTQRRALAARIGDYFYVAPDNGLLTLLIEKAQTQNQPLEIIALEEPRYWLPEITASFHGRDTFAPVGAHLVNGLPLEKLGDAIQDPVLIPLPQPERLSTGWQAQVVMIDVFGNLSTNLPESALMGTGGKFRIKIMGETILGLTRTFGDVAPGTLIATIDSTGHLAISVTNGSAQERLGAKVGTPVAVLLND